MRDSLSELLWFKMRLRMTAHAAISSRNRSRQSFEFSASLSYRGRPASKKKKKNTTQLVRMPTDTSGNQPLDERSYLGRGCGNHQRCDFLTSPWLATAEWIRTGCVTGQNKLAKVPGNLYIFKKFREGCQSRYRRYLEHQTDDQKRTPLIRV